MDLELKGHDKRIYEVWLRSPSVFSSDPNETLLAFKIGLAIGLPASRVLKVLRAQPGLDAALEGRVVDFVEQEPNLDFTQREGVRRIRFLGN